MYVQISVDDGTTMNAWTAAPANGKSRGGLLVFQEAFGVNAHIRDVTDRFAALGYTAIAPELFHRTAGPKFEAGYSDFPSVRPHMQALTEGGMSSEASGPFLLLWSELDKHIPDEQRQEVTKALTQANKGFVNVVFSNADHGFFCDARPSYQPTAARISWDLTQSFLNVHL